MLLREVATIRSGYQFRGRIDPDPLGGYRVIQPKDVDRHRPLRAERLDRVAIDTPALPHLVTPGDVLFLSRGQRLYATEVTEPLGDAVANGNFYVLRPRPEVAPDYLAWYVNRPDVQETLRGMAKGSHMPFLARADLARLDVPVPPLATQRILAALGALADRERRLLLELGDLRVSLIDALCRDALHDAR